MIGYLRAEAAEVSTFEHLLWPQRFYSTNTFSDATSIRSMVVKIWDMLGTAFYSDSKLAYKLCGYNGTDWDNKVRNGLWFNVARRLYRHQRTTAIVNNPMRSDVEGKAAR